MSESHNQLVCYIHPKRETQLRCNRCEKPICIKCCTHTPTGYRCSECIRSQQKIFVTTIWYDQIIASGISGVLAYLGSLFAFPGFFSILVAIGTGFAVVLVVRKAVQNRRSPLLKFVMSGTALVVSLIPVGFMIYQQLQLYEYVINFYSILWRLVYAVLVSGSIFYRLKN
jgi:hypothetical protein